MKISDPIKLIETAHEITQARRIVIENINLIYSDKFIENSLEHTNANSIDELKERTKEFASSFFTEDHKNILESLKQNKFQLNISIVFMIESFFSLSNNHEKPEIAVQLNKKIEKLKILGDLKTIYSFKNKESDSNRDYVFAVSLRQMAVSDITGFLNYHFKEYKGDFTTYLNDTLLEHKELFSENTVFKAKEWMKELPISKPQSNKNLQMEWLGTQGQLAELFVELQRKGYIKVIEANKIKNAFTKSKTIQQILKPSVDKYTYESTFEHIFTKKYKPKFEKIDEQ